jgi:excisionase family DNA binding protein
MPLTKSKTKANRAPARRPNQGASHQPEISPAAASDDVLTLAEAAAYLRVSPEEVVRLVGPSGLPGRRIGDQWRFLKSALQAWLATPPTPSSREALLSLAGAWKDDPHLEELRQQIAAQRERAEDRE